MSSATKQRAYHFGVIAETIACVYLWCKGYRILARRFCRGGGEIDIIASKGNGLIAIEVKARKDFSNCLEAVPPWKQQKIARALEAFMSSGKITGLPGGQVSNIRFDVIWVAPWRLPQHVKDAWRM